MTFSLVIDGTRRWHIEQGDCLAVLRSMPSACVDGVITDPPYSSGGAFRGDRMAETSTKYVQTGTKLERPEFAGDTRDQRAYGYWCALWLSECLRVAKQGAPVCVFTDWRQLATTIDAVQAGGWVFRGIVPWDKTEGVRPQMGRFRAQAEYVVWGSAGGMPPREDVGVLPGFFHCVVKQQDKHHITGKPVEVMREIVRIVAPEGVVLDPFAGSGTTVVAALLEGRRGIGVEQVGEYSIIARNRCTNVEAGELPRPTISEQRTLFDGGQ